MNKINLDEIVAEHFLNFLMYNEVKASGKLFDEPFFITTKTSKIHNSYIDFTNVYVSYYEIKFTNLYESREPLILNICSYFKKFLADDVVLEYELHGMTLCIQTKIKREMKD